MHNRNFLKPAVAFIVRYVTSYFEKGRFVPKKTPILSLETTNLCDAKCVFCANSVMQRERGHLDMDIFKKVVDEFAAMGGLDIDFNTTIGEPLLDPFLLQRARYIKEFPQFKSLGFVTNLQWLHKFDINEFLDAGFTWLSISTTLSGRQRYLEFFGVDRYEQTLNNIIHLIQENNKRKNKIVLLFSIKPANESIKDIVSHPDFKMIASKLDFSLAKQVKNYGLCVDDWSGAVKLPDYLKKRPLYPRAFRPCRLLYSRLMIFSNSNIGICSCRDFEADSELILGNAKDISLKQAWAGEKIAYIRSNWRGKNKIPKICKYCAHYLY